MATGITQPYRRILPFSLSMSSAGKFTRNLERGHGEHGAGSKANDVSLSCSWLLSDVFCRLSAKTREKTMASVEISIRALTVSRQRTWGILLKSCAPDLGTR
jgi:hypothetical protein